MISTVGELCDQALIYLDSISTGNKNSAYTPSEHLKAGGVLKTYTFTITCPDINKSTTKTSSLYIKTSEDIPQAYLKSYSSTQLMADWNLYRDEKIFSQLSSSTFVSVSSLFHFLYLFRFFVDHKFCQFTDIYTKSKIWLYNTSNGIPNPELFQPISERTLSKETLDSYISALIKEIINRNSLKTLKASSSSNSCSSSSSSSSCSSSSSSSSCSSSSSSSSSLFIAYFNLM